MGLFTKQKEAFRLLWPALALASACGSEPSVSTTTPASAGASASAVPSASASAPPSASASALPLPSARQLSCGISGGCVVDRDGAVRCWGENHFGQLGLGTRGKVPGKAGPKVVGLPPARSVAVGVHHACALDRDGGVHCWGATYNGQTGDGAVLPAPDAPSPPGPAAAHPKPVAVKGLPSPAVAIDAGVGETCAALSSGAVYCWGSNDYGELGSAGPASSVPKLVPGVNDAVEVALGTEHACARSSGGEVTCWGTTTGGADPPTRLPGLCARQISAGSHFTCAIDCEGRPACVGVVPARPSNGGKDDRGLAPVPGASDGVVEIRAGYWHVCMRDRTGKLACFGGNDSGQIGSGKKADWSQDFADMPQPVETPWTEMPSADATVAGVVEVCAGGMNIRPDGRYRRPASFVDAGATCALTSTDDVYCWGEPGLSYTPIHTTHRK